MDLLSQEIIDCIAVLLPETKVAMEDQSSAVAAETADRERSLFRRLMSKMRHGSVNSELKSRTDTDVQPQVRHWTRASAAVLSHRWQRAVEPVIFSQISTDSSDLQYLSCILSRYPERGAYLRSLTVMCRLTHEHWTQLGVKDALHPLFSALSAESNAENVDLTLRFEAGHPNLRHLTRQGIVLNRIDSKPLGEIAWAKKLDFTPLAAETEKKRRNVLQLHLMEQASLTARFPNLQSVVWHCLESEEKDVRDRVRDGFGRYIAENLPKRRNITNVGISLRVGVLGIVIAAGTQVGRTSYEGFYTNLRSATQHVTDLRYAGIVGPTLFQPCTANTDDDDMTWPMMRTMTVFMAHLSPAGEPYLYGDDFYGPIELDTPLDWAPDYAALQQEQQSGVFEEQPSAVSELAELEHLKPLLAAFAYLLARLPALEMAQMLARRGAAEGAPWMVPWVVCYCAPGKTSRLIDFSEMDIEKPRVWFVTARWRVSKSMVQQFLSAGKATGHGKAVSLIYWSILNAPTRI